MKRERTDVVLIAINAGVFAAALIALAAGAPPRRLSPVALFCGLGTLAAVYVEVANALTRRRARRQTATLVPRDVPLRKPVWISAIDGVSFAMFATPLAALAGAAGFASAGAGVLLTVAALMALGFVLGGIIGPRSLALERDGLRVYLLGVRFLVRWDAIVDVERVGIETNRFVCVRFTGPQALLESVEPATPRARARARFALSGVREPILKLTLSPWTGGIDGAALARAIGAARAPESVRSN